ncbi:recombination mediator RecR [Peredibacter starrii]|uniref:Recombination protein RecR n=1 Tax=Peredibacter starrii TaxID=28202 RepID=A0AAX4HQA2_9BACT|nr:recombination mediator RecR [Peredibacter starrii]WPU65464.1 recombination mediator RecR [Peredibacter starrii]
MIQLPEVIKNAVDALTKLPGVGEKTAFRMVMSMTNWKASELKVVGDSLTNLKDLKLCQDCGMFADEDKCSICADEARAFSRTLCVVENASDLMAIEKSGNFRGVYHILGGVLNPLLGVGPDELRMDELRDRIVQKEIEEVILAINPSVEGDATCSYFKTLLPETIRVERIGFGVPIGGSLEYLDPMTITKALENRKRF